ncbi:MAG: recombinase family protein [Segetibacter sp.]
MLKWAFQEISNGILAADQIRREANKKGLKCSRSNFLTAVRNPIYCGKIFIPKFKEDESHLVQGQHEPLISEALFYEVQDTLDGRKRKERPNTKIISQDNLLLRGFLTCSKCNRMLTESASKGKY